MAGLPPPCSEQQRLIAEVQKHLLRIAELSRHTSDAVANQDDDMVRQLDREVESEIGNKERVLGALRQHRRDHGC